MQIFFILITVCAGIASALQSGTNQTLQKALETPLWTVAIIATITAACAIVAAGIGGIAGQRLPTGTAVAAAPWWSWVGGVLGLGFVLGTVFASPKLGGGLFMAAIVTAELLMGLALDHFGLLGFEVHRAGWGRMIGAVLMVAGLSLIAAF